MGKDRKGKMAEEWKGELLGVKGGRRGELRGEGRKVGVVLFCCLALKKKIVGGRRRRRVDRGIMVNTLFLDRDSQIDRSREGKSLLIMSKTCKYREREEGREGVALWGV